MYRKTPLPIIYTRLGFLRKSGTCMIADCPEDLPRLQQLQDIVAGNSCLSEIEWSYALFVKAEFPDDVLEAKGTSDVVIKWRVFYWKLWDAESLVTDHRPAEAVCLTNAGIRTDFVNSVAHSTSCLPMLRVTEDLFESADGTKKGYQLNSEMAVAIKQIEKPLFASMKLRVLKQLKPTAKGRSSKASGNPQVPLKLRDTILRKNKYRCILCGRNSSDTKLEVNHIIPRNLINKLNLDSGLHTAPENLCATCFDCNRGKSDNLATEDIEYYRDAFSNPGHPNHGILLHLTKISELQTLRSFRKPAPIDHSIRPSS